MWQQRQACAVAEKLLAKFRSPFVINGQSFLVTLSIGIAYGPDDGATADELLRNADSALNHAKQSQGDNFQLFDRAKHDQLHARLRTERLLHAALSNNEFLLNYQPVVSASDGAVTGVEALIRWNSPELGMVPPIKFIDILEETGLIVPVGAWVLEEACRQARQWLDEGIGPLTLSVNVSARQFRDPELVPVVRDVLERTGFPARLLQLELTESMLMHDPAASAARMRELTSHSIRIAIDDFGTGYSSLAYFEAFQPGHAESRSIVRQRHARRCRQRKHRLRRDRPRPQLASVRDREGVETLEQQKPCAHIVAIPCRAICSLSLCPRLKPLPSYVASVSRNRTRPRCTSW